MRTTIGRISNPSSVIPLSKRVFLVARSDGWKRLFSASVPSEKFDDAKRRNRVSKQERRKMLESFVERYRASNAGKFPTVTQAQKEIGGSYYVLREMIQELKYNYKFPPLRTDKPSTGAKPDVDEDPLINDEKADEVKAILISVDMEKPLVNEQQSHLTAEVNQSSNYVLQSIENSSISKQTGIEDQPDIETPEKNMFRSAKEKTDRIVDSNKPQSSPVAVQLETKVDSLQATVRDMQGNSEDENSIVDSLVSVEPEEKDDILYTTPKDMEGTSVAKSSVMNSAERGQRSNEDVSKFTGDKSKMIEGASSPKKVGVWENIKSLADGIIKLWRK